MSDKSLKRECPACGTDDIEIVQRTAARPLKSGGEARYVDEYSKCRACDEEFYTYEQSMSRSRASTAAVRTAEGLFTPDEIRQARLRLKMTQEQFERALGVGRKTVVRWEKGTVPPSRAANGLLWVALNYPSIFMEYAHGRIPSKPECASEITHTLSMMLGVSTGSFAGPTEMDPESASVLGKPLTTFKVDPGAAAASQESTKGVPIDGTDA